MDAEGDWADIAKTGGNHLVFIGFGRLEVDLGSLEEFWSGFLGHWMASGWLADGLAGDGWGWLGDWLATGPPRS